MKKSFLIILCLLVTSVTFFSCNEKINSEEKPINIEKTLPDLYKTKVVFRHHGNGDCPCPNCVCPGCKCPLGICACKVFEPWTALTEEEELDGQVGAAFIHLISDTELLVVLGMQAYDEYGNVEIEEDFDIDNNTVAAISEYSKITVTAGTYSLLQDEEYGAFGAIIIEIKCEP